MTFIYYYFIFQLFEILCQLHAKTIRMWLSLCLGDVAFPQTSDESPAGVTTFLMDHEAAEKLMDFADVYKDRGNLVRPSSFGHILIFNDLQVISQVEK